MKAIDVLNHKIGRNTVVFVGSGLSRDWYTKRDFRSRRYITDINELLVAYADGVADFRSVWNSPNPLKLIDMLRKNLYG